MFILTLNHVGHRSDTHLQSHYKSPIWKLELLKFNLEIEAIAWQLTRRGAREGGGS